MGKLTTLMVVSAATALFCVSAALAVNIDTVTIGDPGNAPDTAYGSVSATYNIGKYEVTNAQYAEFLNAVADTDTYGLYNTSMASGYGGITRSGSSPDYTYDVIPGRGNMPVNYVSWYDTLRFANWMHNGQPTGMQDTSTTEDGAYDMSLGLSAVRKPGALVFLPTEDEWYKAAYYKGGGINAGYWDYPTASDMEPTAEAPPGTTTNGSANYNFAANSDLTDVGAYTYKPSDSAYGTFDQGGNVAEWNEGISSIPVRILRGGSFVDLGWSLQAANRKSSFLTSEYSSVGFRVVEVPEPSDEPPEVMVADMLEIWPPNHKYRTFNLSDCVVEVQDACEGPINVDDAGTIVSIYSDEPEDAQGVGDGQTVDDIVILGSSSFKVRAERQGRGNGRVYGVTFDVADAAGNITTATCYVGIPHDKSGDPPVDDGPDGGYTTAP